MLRIKQILITIVVIYRINLVSNLRLFYTIRDNYASVGALITFGARQLDLKYLELFP